MANSESTRIETRPHPSRTMGGRDDRAFRRCLLGEARGQLIYKSISLLCQFTDISLGGCCLRTECPFVEGSLAEVEVLVPISGMMLRMNGVIQWVGKDNLLGVRFIHWSARSKNQLACLLTGLMDESVADVVSEAVASNAFVQAPGSVLIPQHIESAFPQSATSREKNAEAPPQDNSHSGLCRKRDTNEVRPNEAHSSVIRFLKSISLTNAAITELNFAGCRLHTVHPFPAGIHERLELSFQLQSLPFQLVGVTTDIDDKHTAHIRFLEMSKCKSDELSQVLAEMKDTKSRLPEVELEKPQG